MTMREPVVELFSVPQGACPTCGGRVYKAGILALIESLMRDVPHTPSASAWSNG